MAKSWQQAAELWSVLCAWLPTAERRLPSGEMHIVSPAAVYLGVGLDDL